MCEYLLISFFSVQLCLISHSSESRDSEEKIRDLAVNKVGNTGSLDLLDSSYKTRTRHSDAYL